MVNTKLAEALVWYGTAEKEIHRVHAADAILGGGRHRVERDHGLRIVVAKVAERLEIEFHVSSGKIRREVAPYGIDNLAVATRPDSRLGREV